MNITFYELDSYINGHLIPFTIELDDVTDRDMYLEMIQDELKKIKDKYPQYNCEEWIVCDYKGIPKQFVNEYDVKDELFEYLELLKTTRLDEEVIDAGIALDIPLDEIKDAYQGYYHNDQDFAIEYAEMSGFKEPDSWPYNCIDWEQAAITLMQYYSEHNGYYFSIKY